MSLKALAKAVLDRNHSGNLQETNRLKQGNISGEIVAKKFPAKINYVACTNCMNLSNGYCKVWNHYPDVPEYECRMCKQFVERINGKTKVKN